MKRLKSVWYLNSLHGGNTKKLPIQVNHFYQFYDAACRIAGCNFNIYEWNTYYSSSLPQQNNSYDCGLFVLMFASVILYGDKKFMNTNVMDDFRKIIKNKIAIEYGAKKYFFEEGIGQYVQYLDISHFKIEIKKIEIKSFPFIPISTEKYKNTSSTLDFLAEITTLVAQESFTVASDIYDTFSLNCQKSYTFNVHGVHIKWSQILPPPYECEKYFMHLYNSIYVNMDLYLRILAYNERKRLMQDEIDVFVGECSVIKFLGTNTQEDEILNYFIKWKIAERDVIVFPQEYLNDLALIILIRSAKKIFVVLETIVIDFDLCKKMCLRFLEVYAFACKVEGVVFKEKEWLIQISPQYCNSEKQSDIFVNMAMMGRVLFNRDSSLIDDINEKIPFIQMEMREDIIEHMKKYDKKPLYKPKKVCSSVLKTVLPKFNSSLVQIMGKDEQLNNIKRNVILSTIFDEYWSGLAGGGCLYGAACKTEETILFHCYDCWGYVHKLCDNPETNDENLKTKDRYICKFCMATNPVK